MNLNGMNMFLEYDWLFKHNPEVSWKTDMIQFTKCPKTCRTHHQNILFTSKPGEYNQWTTRIKNNRK